MILKKKRVEGSWFYAKEKKGGAIWVRCGYDRQNGKCENKHLEEGGNQKKKQRVERDGWWIF